MGWLAIAALASGLFTFILNAVVLIKFESRVSPSKLAFSLNKVLIFSQWETVFLGWFVLLLVILHGAGIHPRLSFSLHL